MGSFLQTCRVVVDPLVWEVLLIILGITAALGLVYLLRHTHCVSNGEEQTSRPLRLGVFVILFLAITYLDNPAYCWRLHILSP